MKKVPDFAPVDSPADSDATVAIPEDSDVGHTFNDNNIVWISESRGLTPEQEEEAMEAAARYDELFRGVVTPVAFRDYLGVPISELPEDEQIKAINEIQSALMKLPYPPYRIRQYVREGVTAVWLPPQERQFLRMDQGDWERFSRNAINYAGQIGISTPSIDTAYVDLGRRYNRSVERKWRYYQDVLEPLQAFDEAFGLKMTVIEK